MIFFFDNVSFSFLFLTLSIAFCAISYSFSYLRYEPLVDKFIIFLNFFIISMVFFVSSNNYITLFLGWELIGISSFVLINFWTTKISTLKSAFKAFSFNKFSDVFLFCGILSLFNVSFSLDIQCINNFLENLLNLYINIFILKVSLLNIINFFFLIAICIKSAQIGAHIWLPDSMEAPVPASALIHSATLVSAGIFLLLRFSILFENNSFFLLVISIIGTSTSFLGGYSAIFQCDTKKILAYSTISHCGFLVLLTTLNNFEFLILYLYIHGFFKASIFMGIGAVNRFNKNNQNIKKMGCFFKYLPFECCFIFFGLIHLAGLPFSLGFVIKHILFLSLKFHIFFFWFIFCNCFFAAFSGLYYASKLIYYIFFDFKKGQKSIYFSSSQFNYISLFFSNSNFGTIFSLILIFFIMYYFCIFQIIVYLGNINFFNNNTNFFKYSSNLKLNIKNILLNNNIFVWINIFFFLNLFFLIVSMFRLQIEKILFSLIIIYYFFILKLLFNL